MAGGFRSALLHATREGLSGECFQTLGLQRQCRAYTTSEWHQCMDPEESDYALPTDTRNVMVMLNGHVDIADEEGRRGGPHGIQNGWFDVDRRAWRVNGTFEDSQWVTHWHEMPPEPNRS